jgi:hypothetical protein
VEEAVEVPSAAAGTANNNVPTGAVSGTPGLMPTLVIADEDDRKGGCDGVEEDDTERSCNDGGELVVALVTVSGRGARFAMRNADWGMTVDREIMLRATASAIASTVDLPFPTAVSVEVTCVVV